MNGKDLRIGNFISVLGNTVEVIKILGEKKIEIHSDILQFWDVDIEDEDEDVKPIPLTEVWLVKLWPEYKDYGIKNNGDSVWFGYTSERYIEIKHVHQLQNLYHSLTGEELTIKS